METKVSIDTTKEAKAFAKECEQIADDYVIKFAFWLLTEKDETKTLRELFEIFKKENGN